MPQFRLRCQSQVTECKQSLVGETFGDQGSSVNNLEIKLIGYWYLTTGYWSYKCLFIIIFVGT